MLIGGRGVTQAAHPPFRERIGGTSRAPTTGRDPPSAAYDWIESCHSAAEWLAIGSFRGGGRGLAVLYKGALAAQSLAVARWQWCSVAAAGSPGGIPVPR